jgi:hypothetical protein
MQNVAPGIYDITLKDKKNEPQWSMGAKIEEIDKRISISPQKYEIPSKIIESPGKTMG